MRKNIFKKALSITTAALTGIMSFTAVPLTSVSALESYAEPMPLYELSTTTTTTATTITTLPDRIAFTFDAPKNVIETGEEMTVTLIDTYSNSVWDSEELPEFQIGDDSVVSIEKGEGAGTFTIKGLSEGSTYVRFINSGYADFMITVKMPSAYTTTAAAIIGMSFDPASPQLEVGETITIDMFMRMGNAPYSSDFPIYIIEDPSIVSIAPGQTESTLEMTGISAGTTKIHFVPAVGTADMYVTVIENDDGQTMTTMTTTTTATTGFDGHGCTTSAVTSGDDAVTTTTTTATTPPGTCSDDHSTTTTYGIQLSCSPSAVTVKEGAREAVYLFYKTGPTSFNTSYSVSYEVEDESVARVAANDNLGDFYVEGIAEGTTNITITQVYGLTPLTYVLPVTVTAADTTMPDDELSETGAHVIIDSMPDKVTYNVGEELDLSGGAYSLYFNGGGDTAETIISEKPMTERRADVNIDTSAFDSTKEGTYTITITYNHYTGYRDKASFEVYVTRTAATVLTPENTTTTTTGTTTTHDPCDTMETTTNTTASMYPRLVCEPSAVAVVEGGSVEVRVSDYTGKSCNAADLNYGIDNEEIAMYVVNTPDTADGAADIFCVEGLTAGRTSITIWDDESHLSCTIPINVLPAEPVIPDDADLSEEGAHIVIESIMGQDNYYLGAPLKLDGCVFSVYYNDGTSIENVLAYEYMDGYEGIDASKFDNTTPGTYPIYINYTLATGETASASFEVRVFDLAATSTHNDNTGTTTVTTTTVPSGDNTVITTAAPAMICSPSAVTVEVGKRQPIIMSYTSGIKINQAPSSFICDNVTVASAEFGEYSWLLYIEGVAEGTASITINPPYGYEPVTVPVTVVPADDDDTNDASVHIVVDELFYNMIAKGSELDLSGGSFSVYKYDGNTMEKVLSEVNMSAETENVTIDASAFDSTAPGYYDVIITYTDDEGYTDTVTLCAAVYYFEGMDTTPTTTVTTSGIELDTTEITISLGNEIFIDILSATGGVYPSFEIEDESIAAVIPEKAAFGFYVQGLDVGTTTIKVIDGEAHTEYLKVNVVPCTTTTTTTMTTTTTVTTTITTADAPIESTATTTTPALGIKCEVTEVEVEAGQCSTLNLQLTNGNPYSGMLADFSSDNPAVAVVSSADTPDHFYIVGISEGTAIITIDDPLYNSSTTLKVTVTGTYEGDYIDGGIDIEIHSLPTKLTYNIGEELDLTGGEYSILKYAGTENEMVINDHASMTTNVRWLNTDAFDSSTPGTYPIIIYYHNYDGYWGVYKFNVTVNDPNASVVGDIDQDNEIGIDDAKMVLDYYARTAANIDAEIIVANADVDGDGEVSIADARYILTYYARNAAGLPCTWDEIITG